MKNVVSYQNFAEFCESKGKSHYDYGTSYDCACGQFIAHIGIILPPAYDSWFDYAVESESPLAERLWCMDHIASMEPHTFKALAKRIRDFIERTGA